MKDPIILGALAGLVGNLVKVMITWIFYGFGWTRYTFEHIAAGVFVGPEFIKNPVSLSIGIITDWTMASVVAILFLLIIRQIGSDIKGLLYSATLYIFVYGVLMALDVTRASLLTPLPNLILLFPHLFFGLTVGWFIDRYGSQVF